MDEAIRVIIADDHPIFREGLVRSIERDRSFVVVGQVGDGAEAVRVIKELHPDLAVLDVAMPVMDGLEVAGQLHREADPTELVILTMYKDAKYFNTALDLGVRGYMLKDSAAVELLSCLKVVSSGQYYISPGVSHLLLERDSRRSSHQSSLSIRERLTPAELAVLRLVAENKTSKEIAEKLFVSFRTVENHRMHLCQKLGIKGPHALLQFALENKSVF
jgi:DNA-binding NarL/FixJ family response regulator